MLQLYLICPSLLLALVRSPQARGWQTQDCSSHLNTKSTTHRTSRVLNALLLLGRSGSCGRKHSHPSRITLHHPTNILSLPGRSGVRRTTLPQHTHPNPSPHAPARSEKQKKDNLPSRASTQPCGKAETHPHSTHSSMLTRPRKSKKLSDPRCSSWISDILRIEPASKESENRRRNRTPKKEARYKKRVTYCRW